MFCVDSGVPINMNIWNSIDTTDKHYKPVVADNKRPVTFKDYIGQTKAKRLLKGYIEGARKRNTQFPHLLIHGPAGVEKLL